MPAISVLDATGATQVVQTLPAVGRLVAATSLPTVFSTEDLAAVNAITAAVGVVPTNGRTTREYAFAAGVRVASVLATSGATVLPTLGTTREVRVSTSAAAYINFGTGAVAATIGATSLRLEANDREILVVPAGMTHFAVIRDAADGFVHLTPVA